MMARVCVRRPSRHLEVPPRQSQRGTGEGGRGLGGGVLQSPGPQRALGIPSVSLPAGFANEHSTASVGARAAQGDRLATSAQQHPVMACCLELLLGLSNHLAMVVHMGVGLELFRPQAPTAHRFQIPLACERDLAFSSLACTVMLHWAQVGEWDPGATLHAWWYAMKSFLPLRRLTRVASAQDAAVPLSSPP